MAAKTVVIDASVAAKWFLAEHGSDAAKALIDGDLVLLAPELILAEVANVYWKHVKRGTKPAAAIGDILSLLRMSIAELPPMADLARRAFEIAVDLSHPVYDCFYLALAEREGTVLVTADLRLLKSAANSGFAKLVRPL
jgi:predicted nucleic acid-binding protein